MSLRRGKDPDGISLSESQLAMMERMRARQKASQPLATRSNVGSCLDGRRQVRQNAPRPSNPNSSSQSSLLQTLVRNQATLSDSQISAVKKNFKKGRASTSGSTIDKSLSGENNPPAKRQSTGTRISQSTLDIVSNAARFAAPKLKPAASASRPAVETTSTASATSTAYSSIQGMKVIQERSSSSSTYSDTSTSRSDVTIAVRPDSTPHSFSSSPAAVDSELQRQYHQFTETLKKEAFGQHMQLNASFVAQITGIPKDKAITLQPRKKVIKFDDQTKAMLAKCNVYLKKQKIKCLSDTQLVNDKKWLKEQQKLANKSHAMPSSIRKQHLHDEVMLMRSTSSEIQSSTAPNLARLLRDDRSAVTQSSRSAVNDAVLQMRSSSSTTTSIHEPVASRPSWSRPKALETHRNMPSLLACEDSESAEPSPASIVPTPTQTDIDTKSNPGLEVTLNQFESKLAPPEFTKVNLKRTNVGSRASMGSGSDVASTTSTQPSWAGIKLRQTSGVPAPITQSNATSELPALEHGEAIENARSASATAKSDEVKEEAKEEADGQCSYDDLVIPSSKTMESAVSTPETISIVEAREEFTLFDLKPTSGSLSTTVMFGKDQLLLVELQQGSEDASIVWKLPREDVHSLNLDTSTFEITLLTSDKTDLTKVLCFASLEDCMKFANIFYDITDVAAKEDEAEQPHTSPLAPLSEEEQNVLETYRKMRLTNSAEAAMQASIPSSQSLSALSKEQDAAAAKYRKMFKLSIPLEAIKHSMKKDEVEDVVVQTVLAELGGSPPSVVDAPEMPSSPVSTMSSTFALSKKDSELVFQYNKMLRLGIPSGAVREQMVKDGLSARIIAQVLDDATTASESQTERTLSKEDMGDVIKYKNMLKLGIPVEGVKHRMDKDGIEARIKDFVLQGTDTKPMTSSVPSQSAKTASLPGLSAAEEETASRYRKMLKAGVPKASVAARMQTNGIADNIMTSVVGTVATAKAKNENAPASKSQGNKLVALHWTPLTSTDIDDSSVWKASKRRLKGHDTSPEDREVSELRKIFEKQSSDALEKQRRAKKSAGDGDKAKLLDITRSNNISISLKAFKEFSFKELADILSVLDAQERISGERNMFLRDLLPNANEVKTVRSYRGKLERLAPAELWFREVSRVSNMERKANILRTLETFDSEASSISENLQVMFEACHEVMNSEKLHDLLGMVLRIGNIMNEGTRTGGAEGFKFDSLLRLTQTKGSDGKTTVLDFLVEVFMKRGQRDTLDLAADIPGSLQGSRMVVGDILSSLRDVKASLKECQDELEALRREAFPQECDDTQGSLLDPTKSHGDGETGPPISKFKMRNRFLDAINQQKQESEKSRESVGAEASSPLLREDSIHGAIARLESFLEKAESVCERLDNEKNSTTQACRDLAKYCAEGGGVGAAPTLLGILSEFAESISSAIRKYDAVQEAKTRRMKRLGQSTTKGPSAKSDGASSTASSERGDGKSFVLMVNEMLKEAPESFKDDFRKGRVAHNPSRKLQAIYDKEKQLAASFGSPQKSRHAVDLVTSLQGKDKDQKKLGLVEEDRARTQFSAVLQEPAGVVSSRPVEGVASRGGASAIVTESSSSLDSSISTRRRTSEGEYLRKEPSEPLSSKSTGNSSGAVASAEPRPCQDVTEVSLAMSSKLFEVMEEDNSGFDLGASKSRLSSSHVSSQRSPPRQSRRSLVINKERMSLSELAKRKRISRLSSPRSPTSQQTEAVPEPAQSPLQQFEGDQLVPVPSHANVSPPRQSFVAHRAREKRASRRYSVSKHQP